MKNIVFLLAIIVLTGCVKTSLQTECGVLKCPSGSNNIYIRTVDANGRATKVAYIETHNLRTGKKEVDLQNPPNYIGTSYTYRLFHIRKDFSTTGDQVNVRILSETGKEFLLAYVIKGGNCVCSVEKISGPSTVTVD